MSNKFNRQINSSIHHDISEEQQAMVHGGDKLLNHELTHVVQSMTQDTFTEVSGLDSETV